MGDSVMARETRNAWTAWPSVAWRAALRKPPRPPTAEPPSLDVTSWTDKSELFMEHTAAVAGQTVRFRGHLTRLATSAR
jgi:hypothetical protein